MKPEKSLNNLNSLEKNSMAIEKILAATDKSELKNLYNVLISKIYILIETELTQFIKAEFVNTSSQLNMLTDIITRDDISMLRGLEDNLSFEGNDALTSSDVRESLQMAIENLINMLLLNIMLPGINGYDNCQKLKKGKPDLPVTMITANGSETDKVEGLDFDADDYITKPFSIPESLARLRAVSTKALDSAKDIEKYSFGNVSLDFIKFQAFVNNEEIKLSCREFAVIKYLIVRDGEVIHRHDLLEKVWGYDVAPSTRTVDNYILNLRKKLEKDPANPEYIISIRGAGYKFESVKQ